MIEEDVINEILANKVYQYHEYMRNGDVLDNLIGKIVIAELRDIALEVGLDEI